VAGGCGAGAVVSQLLGAGGLRMLKPYSSPLLRHLGPRCPGLHSAHRNGSGPVTPCLRRCAHTSTFAYTRPLCARSTFHADSGQPDMGYVLNILLDIALGLAFMHSHNVIHGDLKPDNVLLATSSEGLVAKVSHQLCVSGMSPHARGGAARWCAQPAGS
jgi:serine/threonine protein kinase